MAEINDIENTAIHEELNAETPRHLAEAVEMKMEIFTDLTPPEAIPPLNEENLLEHVEHVNEPSSSLTNADSEIIVIEETAGNDENEPKRKFPRGTKHKYSLEERTALGELCKQYKDEYNKQTVQG